MSFDKVETCLMNLWSMSAYCCSECNQIFNVSWCHSLLLIPVPRPKFYFDCALKIQLCYSSTRIKTWDLPCVFQSCNTFFCLNTELHCFCIYSELLMPWCFSTSCMHITFSDSTAIMRSIAVSWYCFWDCFCTRSKSLSSLENSALNVAICILV